MKSLKAGDKRKVREMRTVSGLGCSGWSNGDLRLVKRTCLFPRCIDGCWCWLTPLYVVQAYLRTMHEIHADGSGVPSYKWINRSWSRKRPEGTFFVAEADNSENFVRDGL